MSDSVHELCLPVQPPFRLDLTATVLRRLSTNVVDGRVYRRILGPAKSPVLLEVTQRDDRSLSVRVSASPPTDVTDVVRRMLGLDVDLTAFAAATRELPWLARLADSARGVRPPRYPSLWEAVVNAVIFQQVSIHAAAAILRRVIERFEPVQTLGPLRLAPFPTPQPIVDADPLELRALGLSINKIVALRTLGRAMLDGQLDAAALEPLPTPELTARLETHQGIGPWTAAVIALRGFGRLDVFPMRDSGVARSLIELSGDPAVDAAAILERLGPQRGMLYYHLLLGRLAARGEIVLEAR